MRSLRRAQRLQRAAKWAAIKNMGPYSLFFWAFSLSHIVRDGDTHKREREKEKERDKERERERE